jgi:hypothetical protein
MEYLNDELKIICCFLDPEDIRRFSYVSKKFNNSISTAIGLTLSKYYLTLYCLINAATTSSMIYSDIIDQSLKYRCILQNCLQCEFITSLIKWRENEYNHTFGSALRMVSKYGGILSISSVLTKINEHRGILSISTMLYKTTANLNISLVNDDDEDDIFFFKNDRGRKVDNIDYPLTKDKLMQLLFIFKYYDVKIHGYLS